MVESYEIHDLHKKIESLQREVSNLKETIRILKGQKTPVYATNQRIEDEMDYESARKELDEFRKGWATQ